MKTIPIALAGHYAQDTTSVAMFLKVTRADGVVVGLTSCDKDITVDGVVYLAGLDVSSLQSTDTLAVDNLEMRALPQDAYLVTEDIIAGRWNGAKWELFQANWADPTQGVDTLKRGTTGEVKIGAGDYTLEFRSLSQALQQTQGNALSRTCRDRLGGPHCALDLAPFTFTGALSAVTSARQVADAARGEADDYFGEGTLKMTSGPAAGLTRKVKIFAGGAFTLALPFTIAPEVGDTYVAVAGCRKRHERSLENPDGVSDCVDKFDNLLNFWGEPHGKGLDAATGKGTANNPQPAVMPEYATDTQDFPGGP